MTTRSQASTPSPDLDDEPLEATMPGFRAPPPTPGPDPLDPETTTISDGPDWSNGPELDEPNGAVSGSSTRTTSSPASTDPLAFVEIARTLVGLVSMVVRAVRQRRRPDLHPAVWIADEDDQAAIGDPLARIAARHTPMTGDAAGDTVDGMNALIGTAGYVVKGMQFEANLQHEAGPIGVDGQAVDDGPVPAAAGQAGSW